MRGLSSNPKPEKEIILRELIEQEMNSLGLEQSLELLRLNALLSQEEHWTQYSNDSLALQVVFWQQVFFEFFEFGEE